MTVPQTFGLLNTAQVFVVVHTVLQERVKSRFPDTGTTSSKLLNFDAMKQNLLIFFLKQNLIYLPA